MQLRFSDFKPVFRARTQLGMPPIDAANICSLQLMLSKFEADGALNPTFKEGPFELPVQQISGGRAGGRAGGPAAGGFASWAGWAAAACACVRLCVLWHRYLCLPLPPGSNTVACGACPCRSTLLVCPAAYMAQPLTPRFVLVGSAGVTRPDRPGIDVDLEPPAVRMNDMLGGILTYKLAGGDSTRPALPCSALLCPALPCFVLHASV